MKWSQMSVFHKILVVVCILCLAAYICVAGFSASGLLPNLYEIPWAQALFGMCWASQAVLNWKERRVMAIGDAVIAVITFATAFLGWFVK